MPYKCLSEIASRLSPYIGRLRGDTEQIDNEIKHVAWLITDAAEKTLPLQKVKKHRKLKIKSSPSYASKARKHGECGTRVENLRAGHYMRRNAPIETRCGNVSGSVLPLMKEDMCKSVKISSKKTHNSAFAHLTNVENPNVRDCVSMEQWNTSF